MPLNQCGGNSLLAGDSQAEIYSKRKALEVLKDHRYNNRFPHTANPGGITFNVLPVGIFHLEYSQKRTKIEDGSLPLLFPWDIFREGETICRPIRSPPSHDRDTIEIQRESPRSVESSDESTSIQSYSDSDSDGKDSCSTTSSPSTFRAPGCEHDQADVQQQSECGCDSNLETIDVERELDEPQIKFQEQLVRTSSSCTVVAEVRHVAPVTSYDRTQENIQGTNTFPSVDDMYQLSRDSSSTPSVASQDPTYTPMDEDNPSTEGDRTSQSLTSSESSDSSFVSSRKNRRDDLEALIKDDVLRAAPELAECFYLAVKGTLECLSADDLTDIDRNGELSLFRGLELEAFGIIHIGGNTKSSAPSTHSSSSSSTPFSTSTATGQGSGSKALSGGAFGGSDQAMKGKPNDRGPSQLIEPQKSRSKPGTSQSVKPQRFRCVHNALAPMIFCANSDTGDQFRTCAGPGWESIQRLKEHMNNVHAKAKKPNLLQCSRCQEEFSDQEDLRIHELNIDCTIRCIKCREEFTTKALRQQHQKETHFEEVMDLMYMEIDDAMSKTLKENLKVCTDSLKKAKGKVKGSLDAKLEQWVTANIPRHEVGRSARAKANSSLELSQWYTIFRTLARRIEIPEHPYYDNNIPHSEYSQEKIIYINERMVESKIEAYGPPPQDLDLQRAWYTDALRDSMKMVAKCTVPHLMTAIPYHSSATSLSLGPSLSGGVIEPISSSAPQITSSNTIGNDLSTGIYFTNSEEQTSRDQAPLSHLPDSTSKIPNEDLWMINSDPMANPFEQMFEPSSSNSGEHFQFSEWQD